MTSGAEADAAARSGPPCADLVLEGGGVKGLALVGAVDALVAAGYRFPRVAGTSAGAIVAAFVAALQHAGEPLERLADVARTVDYRRLRDRGPFGRIAGPLRPVIDGLSLAFENGVFEGDYLSSWLRGALGDLGVRTFADLRLDRPPTPLPAGPPTAVSAGRDAPEALAAGGVAVLTEGGAPDGGAPDRHPLPQHRYALVVTASDVSRQRLVRLPWDYPRYGLDPDEQLVADAVRTSASIPFYYEPMTLRSPDRSVSTLVDGGVLSNFPIALFDRTDGRPPRWPTFGVRLSARDRPCTATPVTGPVSLALLLVETLIEACDAQHIDDPCVQARTVFVDTSGISPVDFALSPEQQEALLDHGRQAARAFLATWDWPAYLARCRSSDVPSEPPA